MNALAGLALPQLQERELHLLLEWERLVEHGLKILDADRPDALQSLAADKARLIAHWRELRAASLVLGTRTPASGNDNNLQRELRTVAERAMSLNRRYEMALRARELFIVTRLQALCSATGQFGVYSGAGQITTVSSSRKSAYLA